MAEELKHKQWDLYAERKKIKAEIKYPWDQWLNGSMWLLLHGEDFDVDTKQFQKYIYNYCYNHGIRVKQRLHRNGKDIYLKAYANNTRQGRGRQRHFEAVEERRLKMVYGSDWRDHLAENKKEKVLDVLLANAGEWVNGPALTHPSIGGSEGLRRLRELRADGYFIEMRKHPDKGRTVRQYRLLLGDPTAGGTQLKMFDNGKR